MSAAGQTWDSHAFAAVGRQAAVVAMGGTACADGKSTIRQTQLSGAVPAVGSGNEVSDSALKLRRLELETEMYEALNAALSDTRISSSILRPPKIK